jgi:cytidine deaminase
MPKVNRQRLVAAALRARERAVAPYSRFKVGAALLTTTGKIVTGANVESASYGLTCCAERIALFKALSEGDREFAAIAVVARVHGGPMPCGACRQLLSEYAPAAQVWVADSGQPRTVREFSVAMLLPGPFRKAPAGAPDRMERSRRLVFADPMRE